jgi:hypothetical protein
MTSFLSIHLKEIHFDPCVHLAASQRLLLLHWKREERNWLETSMMNGPHLRIGHDGRVPSLLVCSCARCDLKHLKESWWLLDTSSVCVQYSIYIYRWMYISMCVCVGGWATTSISCPFRISVGHPLEFFQLEDRLSTPTSLAALLHTQTNKPKVNPSEIKRRIKR